MDLASAAWKKSTRSADTFNCVEVAYSKSKRSADSGLCLEVGRCECGCEPVIYMRDSKNPTGPVLQFDLRAWDAFVGGAKEGEFDL
jgi:Domain of unknown function (DUF397)